MTALSNTAEAESSSTSIESTNGLAAAIDQADPGALLMSMVHITGDLALLDEFEEKLGVAMEMLSTDASRTHYGAASGADIPPPGQYPKSVIADIRERARLVLTEDLTPKMGTPDPELFCRMASLCAAGTVTEEFVPLLLEQAGFHNGQRVVPVTKKPPADHDVIVIGAGMIGLNAAIKLGQAGFNYTVFESRDDIGGTWTRNIYPGAAVDTPSHYYSYSFELNPDWSMYYPTGPEYLNYLHGVADKYDLYKKIRLSTRVESAEWSDSDQKWTVVTRDGRGGVERHTATSVITALGVLNSANIPDIPGLGSFNGRVVHTAEWDPTVDLADKRVVVVGTGCTAVQVVANIVDTVASLDAVVRSPHWIVPEKAVVRHVPEGEKWAMRHLPFFQEWFRFKAYWLASDNLWVMPRIDPEWAATHLSASPTNDLLLQTSMQYLERTFADRPDLKSKLTPTIRPYAKRIVKDPGYLEALKRDHVTLHRASPVEVHPDGVTLDDGTFVKADVILLATGFRLEYVSSINVVGRGGNKLADLWKNGEDPRAYLGIQVPGFPNLFVTAGPNAAPNHGAGHNVTSEEHVHYIIECLQYLVENDYSSMDVRQEAHDTYNRQVEESLDQTVWAHPGEGPNTGYYRNKAGRVIVSCPWRIVDYWTMLREPKAQDFIFSSKQRN
ncbi:NAD(P)/FAD-dependent oxidoreductase [Nocardia sp. 348MFTsu5.1]|uniref:flavin-containing monooxygenase n=1 Tax=Nocardia sp. 348MFTsu5.1 TaxID=1172185 RepID=UPI00037A353F|nr:NAD(P)/FAD-dependent oxidoreductase [Nocardia sp. 348MFTsu5.1]